MSKYIQGKDGRFAGSIGDGKSSVPSATDAAVRTANAVLTTTPPPNYTDIHARFASLARGHDWILRQPITDQFEIVRDPEVSPALLHSLAVDERTEPAVLVEVVKSERATPETVQALSTRRSTVVRCWAAWDPRLPVSELPRLSRDRDVNIRQGVCEHADAPVAVLMHAGSRATEPDRFVRQSAKDHRNYPKKAARLDMAQNADTTNDVLMILAGDGHPQVARTARQRLEAQGIEVPEFAADDD